MLFAVIRTINIASPFSRIRRKLAVISIFVWLLIWVTISSLEVGLFVKTALDNLEFADQDQGWKTKNSTNPYTFNNAVIALEAFFYQPNKGKLFSNYLIEDAYVAGKGEDVDYAELYAGDESEVELTGTVCLIDLVYTASPVFLCAGITLIVTIIQVVFLLKRNVSVTDDPEGDHRTRMKISVTIILIGSLFITCSACTLFQPLLQCNDKLYDKLHISKNFLRTVYATSYIPFFLNAALNPLILVVRVSQVRLYMWSLLSGRRRVSYTNPSNLETLHARPQRKESRFETFITQVSSTSLLGKLVRRISGGTEGSVQK
jgi:hypothetical protein